MSKNNTRIRPGYWTAEGWPKVFIGAGWILFWLAGVAGQAMPMAVLLVGPGMMFAGIFLMVCNRPDTR